MPTKKTTSTPIWPRAILPARPYSFAEKVNGTAVHEAGHTVVGRYFKDDPVPAIYRCTCGCEKVVGMARSRHLESLVLEEKMYARAVIAAAGSVAWHLWARRRPVKVSPDDAAVIERLNDNLWTYWDQPNIEEAITIAEPILTERWDEVEEVALAIVEAFYAAGQPTKDFSMSLPCQGEQ